MDSLFGNGFVCWALDLLGRTAYWCLDSSLASAVFICRTNGIAVSHRDHLDFTKICLTASRLCNSLHQYPTDLKFVGFALVSPQTRYGTKSVGNSSMV